MDAPIKVKDYKIPKKIRRKLEKKYIRFNKQMGAYGIYPMDQVRLVYDFLDYYNRWTTVPYSVCKAGCAHCCHIPVGVTPIEALYISECKGILANRDDDLQPDMGIPCPFLNATNNQCEIYDCRPIVCRMYHTFDDPKFCWPPDQDHWVTGTENAFGNESIAEIIRGVHVMAQPLFEWDVRKWFPKGLRR